MPRITLNKSELQKEQDKLRLYRRLLPSLDLKRRQLTLELGRARAKLEGSRKALQELRDHAAEQLPMLANREDPLSGIVKVRSVQVTEQNVVGVDLPVLGEVEWAVQEYSLLAEPPWVDLLVAGLKEAAAQTLAVQVETERVRRLERADRRITQRINLFEKILIPGAQENIRRIRIFLGDAEMAAVVRSKIAKGIHERKRRNAEASAGEAG